MWQASPALASHEDQVGFLLTGVVEDLLKGDPVVQRDVTPQACIPCLVRIRVEYTTPLHFVLAEIIGN